MYTDILGENSRIIPITNQIAINYIKAESKNLKYVRESLDFIYSDITLNEDGRKVVLTSTDGDKMIVNLESYITNEIMDYCVLQSKVRDSSF